MVVPPPPPSPSAQSLEGDRPVGALNGPTQDSKVLRRRAFTFWLISVPKVGAVQVKGHASIVRRGARGEVGRVGSAAWGRPRGVGRVGSGARVLRRRWQAFHPEDWRSAARHSLGVVGDGVFEGRDGRSQHADGAEPTNEAKAHHLAPRARRRRDAPIDRGGTAVALARLRRGLIRHIRGFAARLR